MNYNINHNLIEKKWHLSKYTLFTENPNNKEEIYCVNLLTQKKFILTQKEFKLLFKINKIKDEKLFEKFVKNGLIINFDEYSLIKIMSKKSYEISNYLTISICPTMNCNFKCPYCFEKHHPGKMNAETQNDIINLIKKIVEKAPIKKINITWFGGEPLLYPEIIKSLSKKIISFCEEKNIIYTSNIITNGYLLTQEIADMLSDLKVSKYQITLDGFKEDHDNTRCLINGNPTFDKIIENLTNIKINGLIQIRQNIHKNNYKNIQEFKNLIKDLRKKSGNNIVYYFGDITKNDNTADK